MSSLVQSFRGSAVLGQSRQYRFGAFRVDPERWELLRSGQVVHLEPVVLRLLVFLIEHRDRLVTKQELMDTVWGNTVVSESALSKAIARLRKALDDEAGHPKFIETAHGLGYRFIAEMIEPGDQEVERAVSLGANRKKTSVALWLAPLLLLVMFMLVADPFGWREAGVSDEAETPIRSVAVLPLANLAGDPSQNYFVEGLQDVLITDLSKIAELRVTSRQSTLRYRGSNQALPEIAAELNVDALIEGGALVRDGRVKVTAQLIDGRTDRHLWAETYDRDLRDVLVLLNEIARTISNEIEIVLSPQEAERLASTRLVDPLANEAYLKGLFQLNQFPGSQFHKALDYFKQAVEIEPEFALAWSGLAGANLMSAYYGSAPPRESVLLARAAALRSLELDEQHYAGHAALGWVRLMTWDWPGAGEAFEEALSRNPNDPMTLHGYADFLTLAGRAEEGLGYLRHAISVDPHSPSSILPLPFHLYMMRRYEEALERIQWFMERNPEHPVNHMLMVIYWEQGRQEEAVSVYREQLLARGYTKTLAALDRGYAEGGPMAAMRSVAMALAEQAKQQYIDPMNVASAFSRAGEIEAALQWLQKALDNGSPELMYIAVRPDFDALREDPRFKEILRRIGLPHNP